MQSGRKSYEATYTTRLQFLKFSAISTRSNKILTSEPVNLNKFSLANPCFRGLALDQCKEVTMPEMDLLNQMLRFTVIFAWKSSTRKLKFRDQNVAAVMEALACSENEAISYLENGVWGCGDSAPRICFILTGNSLKMNFRDGIDVEDDPAMNQMYKDILRAGGPILARIDVKSTAAGHAYVFVSRGNGNPLEGYIYQTNVGILDREYDLFEWVRDKKSSQAVFLPGHLAEVQNHLIGYMGGANEVPWDTKPAKLYAENYLLSGKKVPDSAKDSIRDTPALIRVSWRSVNTKEALRRLREICQTP